MPLWSMRVSGNEAFVEVPIYKVDQSFFVIFCGSSCQVSLVRGYVGKGIECFVGLLPLVLCRRGVMVVFMYGWMYICIYLS